MVREGNLLMEGLGCKAGFLGEQRWLCPTVISCSREDVCLATGKPSQGGETAGATRRPRQLGQFPHSQAPHPIPEGHRLPLC